MVLKKSVIIFLLITLCATCLYGVPVDTLSVLPFKLIGKFDEPELYEYGIPEAIAHDLAQVRGLTIVDRLKLSSLLNELQLAQTGLISETSAPNVGKMIGAKKVIVAMTHVTTDGEPKIVKECTYPLTARGVVSLIVTDLAVIEVTPEGLLLTEVAPGLTAEDVECVTEAKLKVSPNLTEVQL